jgi:hypothetical protein
VLLTSEEFVAISVENYPPHESVGLLLLVEYDIGVEIDEASQYDAVSTVKAALKQGDLLVSTVSIGAAVFLPLNENTFELRNILLPEGEEPSADSLSIELELETGELCRLVSPNLIFKGEQQHRVAESDENEANEIVVGFDLKVFDRRREYKHGDLYEDDDDDQETIDDDKSSVSTKRRKPIIHPSSVRGGPVDLDDFAPEPSIVGGSSEASSLRLDFQYYGTFEDSLASRHQDYSFQREPLPTRTALLPPSDPNSLLRRSLKTQLSDADRRKSAPQEDNEFLEARGEGTRADPRPLFDGSHRVAPHSREMTRASKSRLSRHGFSDAIGDSIIHASPPTQPNKYTRDTKMTQSVSYHPAVSTGTLIPVDIDVEATDPLSISEIIIQFGGYRVGTFSSKKDTGSAVMAEGARSDHRTMHTPHSIYCTYQFYTCHATRTEAMRLLPPSETNSFSVLVREDSTSRRIETPLLLRHIIDSGNVSTLEGYEFAEYLAYSTLYIDVWDSDSLLHIGVVAFPLRSLMRQGRSSSKTTLECDILNHDLSVVMDKHGLPTSVMVDGQAPLGLVVGSLSIIASNVGTEGQKTKRKDQSFMEHGLNWRTSVAPGKVVSKRPKNSVRARPLSESAPDLQQVLEDYRHSNDSKPGAMKSLSSVRGNEGLATLTYDEVISLFKRFKGTSAGTVQYEGPLLKLLDVPSWSAAIRKLIKMFKKSRLRGNTLKNVPPTLPPPLPPSLLFLSDLP